MRTTVVGLCLVGLALIAVSIVVTRRQRQPAEADGELGRWEGEGGAVPVSYANTAAQTSAPNTTH